MRVASLSVEETYLAVRAAVKSAYAELLRIDRTAAILGESRGLLESYRDAARARYESGEGILENILRAQTELTKLELTLAGLARERRSVEASLGALLGRPQGLSLGPATREPRIEDPGPGPTEKTAREASPALLVVRAVSAREQARLELAKKNLKPDFMWGASYQNRGGLDPMVMGMFGIRLPIHRSHMQAEAVAQTESELDAARREAEGRESELLARLRDLRGRAESAATEERLYDEGLIPQARSALDSAAASYQAGRAEFVTLIEDFLAVLTYQVEREGRRAERIQALAEIEALTGATIVLPADSTVASEAGPRPEAVSARASGPGADGAPIPDRPGPQSLFRLDSPAVAAPGAAAVPSGGAR